LMFNAWFEKQPKTFSFTLNGHRYSFAWPFPYKSSFAMNSFMFPVNRADLVAGPNTIMLWSDQYMVVENVNVMLAGAGGVPGSNSNGGGSVVVPTVALSANPTSITAGNISTVTWSSTNASSCTSGGGWTGTQPTSGILGVSPSSTTTYALTCTGTGGTSPMA